MSPFEVWPLEHELSSQRKLRCSRRLGLTLPLTLLRNPSVTHTHIGGQYCP